MALQTHRPYPGVALLATEGGTVLVGAPTDAFKATKAYCQRHNLPFPRVLVAPPALLVGAAPQFNPEFFLYDFLFVYGAAFKPELEGERLVLVVDESQVDEERQALRITLTGPTRAEMRGYTDADGKPLLAPQVADQLADVAEHMAIKKDGRARTVDDMVEFATFDAGGRAELLDGRLTLTREGNFVRARSAGDEECIDLSFSPPVIPFATLPAPTEAQTPATLGIKPLGTRSGFDLSGPTTGFLLWVNGRAVIYDGPVGTRYLLDRQGITFEDVAGVILSHCHEDHMGAFVEMILAGHRPRVFTAEPIYRSALLKLSSCFRQPEAEVAKYIDYQRITPGEPLTAFGADFSFFYTIHSIPTVGVRVNLPGDEHTIQISGDTMNHDGLDAMKKERVLSRERYEQLRHLVPDKKHGKSLFFADVGEAIIHGHPSDWQDNPNQVLYYHCPDNEHTRSFGRHIAVPGESRVLVDAPQLHPSVPGRLLSALRFLDIDEPSWLSSILFSGRSRAAAAGEILVAEGEKGGGRTFSVIVSGSAAVLNGDEELTLLRPGEFFGAIELVNEDGRHTATVKAITPMEIFDVDAQLFYDYVRDAGLEDALQRIWTQRPAVEGAALFRQLDRASRTFFARTAYAESHGAGDTIVEQGQMSDDFYLLTEGRVDLLDGDEIVATISADDRDNFFGVASAVYPSRPRPLTAQAATNARTLRIEGRQVRRLFERDMGVRYVLSLAIERRTANLPG
jgi:CRP-like cAMP-binding protein